MVGVEGVVEGVVVESGVVDGEVVESGVDGVVVESGADGVVGDEFGVVGVGTPGDDGVNGADESGAVGAAGVSGFVVLGAAGVVGTAFGAEGVVESGVVLGVEGDESLGVLEGDELFGVVSAGFEGELEGDSPGTARPGVSVLGDRGVVEESPDCPSGLSGDIAGGAIGVVEGDAVELIGAADESGVV